MPCSLCQSSTHNRRSATCPVNIANQNGRRPSAELRPRTQSILQQAFSGPVGISETNTSNQYMGPTGPTGRTVLPFDETSSPENPVALSRNHSDTTAGQSNYQTPTPVHTAMRSRVVVANTQHSIVSHDEALNEYMLLYQNLRPLSQYVDRESRMTYNIYRLLEIPGQPAIPQHYMSSNNKVIIRRIGAMYFTAIGVSDGYNIRRLDLCEIPTTDEDVYIIIPQIPWFNIPIIKPIVSAKTEFENHIKKITYEINEPDVESPPCENTCAVCLDHIQPEHFVHTNCNHGYCSGCISKHIKTQQTKFQNLPCIPKEMVELPCPLCRTNINKLVFIQEEQRQLMRNFVMDEIL